MLIDAKLTQINAVSGYLPAGAFKGKQFHTIGLHFQNHIYLNEKKVQQLPVSCLDTIWDYISMYLSMVDQLVARSHGFHVWSGNFSFQPCQGLCHQALQNEGGGKTPRTFPGVWSHIIWKKEVGLGPGSLLWLRIWHRKHLCGWRIDWLLHIYWVSMEGLVLNIHEYISTFSP